MVVGAVWHRLSQLVVQRPLAGAGRHLRRPQERPLVVSLGPSAELTLVPWHPEGICLLG